MTLHLPNWARIYRLGREHIFGVYVVTFYTWHLAILIDLVQGIMLASQGKVLTPRNEGSMAVIVYLSMFPQLCLICVHIPISGLPFWCNSCTCPHPCLRVHRETTGVLKGKPSVWIGLDWIVLGSWVLQGSCVKEPMFLFFCGKLWRIGQEHADPGEEQDPRSDRLWWKGYSRGRSW